MTAHITLDIGIIEPEKYKDSIKLTSEAAMRHGGRNWDSSEYTPTCAFCYQYARTNLIAVKGM